MSSPTTFKQFARFTTDLLGLERTLRLFQAIVQIIPAYPLTFDVLTTILNLTIIKPPSTATIHIVLREIWSRIGLVRRFFKLFRFFESFNSAHNLYLSSLNPATNYQFSILQINAWVDILGLNFLGMYYLLEASVIVDELQIDGLRIWTPELEQAIIIEAARFWLFALVCGVISGVLKNFALIADENVEGGSEGSNGKREARSKKDLKGKRNEEENFNMEGVLERFLDIIKETNVGKMLGQAEIRTKIIVIGRRTLANALDILLPASTVGLVHLSSGTIGLTMFVTTVLTSIDVWERCGAKLVGRT